MTADERAPRTIRRSIISTDTTSTAGRHRSVPPERPGRRRWWAGAALSGVAMVIAGAFAVPALADGSTETNPVARAAHAEPATPGTPCSISARACVDLETQRAWLIRDGEVVRGPMTISSGGEGYETPVGHSLRVYRKEADHVSGESRTPDGRPAPMPYSVFFNDGGIAFHAGDPARSSAGCVRMETDDAKAMFDDLQIGDKVQVVEGSEERTARAGS
ncbi:L,D-transpeptidase [Actinomycetospora sp. OC33-EN08]|uniref:L,D-transpeptidase n=1 Tax=Actinomycetospora aurantiaca TaxID=3129233 RepID=A0ABU8MW04_9PSEU